MYVRLNTTKQSTTQTVNWHPTGCDVLLGEKCTPTAQHIAIVTHVANNQRPLNSDDKPYESQYRWRWISPFDLLGFSGLPLNGFTYSWTLSSKFFSTFPHGTCSLSVSWLYLALDGVYHPLRAALSSNPTLRRDSPETHSGHYGPGTLYG